jgi:2-amino-4-hydroxy-6-hydroxymethyldihydropteridine diphosphokinase
MFFDRVFVGLGSNCGDRLDNLTKALKAIALVPETKILNYSSVYETAPVGYVNQRNFLNMVAEIATIQRPQEFLSQLQKIEHELKRIRKTRWGPRTIDLDILYWGDQQIETAELTIPHPQAAKRRFVLVPLNEIAADFAPPPHFEKIFKLLETVADESWVDVFLPKAKYQLTNEVSVASAVLGN